MKKTIASILICSMFSMYGCATTETTSTLTRNSQYNNSSTIAAITAQCRDEVNAKLLAQVNDKVQLTYDGLWKECFAQKGGPQYLAADQKDYPAPTQTSTITTETDPSAAIAVGSTILGIAALLLGARQPTVVIRPARGCNFFGCW